MAVAACSALSDDGTSFPGLLLQSDARTAFVAGESIRSIAENMELSVRTVRTIIDKKDGVDRATLTRLQRIAPDKVAEARARRSIKEVAALPKRINGNLKRNAELIKSAKGLLE
jgi:hypothetical protein